MTENAYTKGYDAYYKGIDKHNNPYTLRTSDWESWLEGWWCGYHSEHDYNSDEEEF